MERMDFHDFMMSKGINPRVLEVYLMLFCAGYVFQLLFNIQLQKRV